MQLEEVLGSKNKIKLLRYLVYNPDWQFNLSEVSKKCSVDKGNISRLIKEFEKLDVIEVKRSGKAVMFRIKNNIHYNMLKEVFHFEKII